MLQQPLLLVKGSVVVKNLVEEEPNMKWVTGHVTGHVCAWTSSFKEASDFPRDVNRDYK
jgi:hypothetical protein